MMPLRATLELLLAFFLGWSLLSEAQDEVAGDVDMGTQDIDDEDYGFEDDYGDYPGDYGGDSYQQPEVKELATQELFDKFIEEDGNEKPVVIAYIPVEDADKSEDGDKDKAGDDDAEKTAEDDDEEEDEPDSEDGPILTAFKAIADGNDYTYTWAYTHDASFFGRKLSSATAFVYKPGRDYKEKYDGKRRARYTGQIAEGKAKGLEGFLKAKAWALVTELSYSSQGEFELEDEAHPTITCWFRVDRERNLSGYNYHMNRMRKVAQEHPKFRFLIADRESMGTDLADYPNLRETPKSQTVVGIKQGGLYYSLGETFSYASLRKFVADFAAGSLTGTEKPKLSDPDEMDDDEDAIDESYVEVATIDNFDEVVAQDKDVLVEFYAPWCGHCKSLKPIYADVAKALSRDDTLTVAKFDASQATPPVPYNVEGFPTLYFKKKGERKPESYDGAREYDAIMEFLAKEGHTPGGAGEEKAEL